MKGQTTRRRWGIIYIVEPYPTQLAALFHVMSSTFVIGVACRTAYPKGSSFFFLDLIPQNQQLLAVCFVPAYAILTRLFAVPLFPSHAIVCRQGMFVTAVSLYNNSANLQRQGVGGDASYVGAKFRSRGLAKHLLIVNTPLSACQFQSFLPAVPHPSPTRVTPPLLPRCPPSRTPSCLRSPMALLC